MRYQKYFIFTIALIIGTIILASPVFAKIWTKDLVSKVILSSGYGVTICPIDLGISGKDLANTSAVIDETPGGSLTAGLPSQEANFVKNPDNFKCTGPSEGILLGNVDLYFKDSQASPAREHLLMYQNDVMSFSNVGYEYYDSGIQLNNVDSTWFTKAKGLRRISETMLMYTNPDINESKGVVPDSRLDTFYAEDGHNVVTLLIYQGRIYKVVDVTKKVTEPTTLVDYTSSGSSPQTDTSQISQVGINTYTNSNLNFKYPSDWVADDKGKVRLELYPKAVSDKVLVQDGGGSVIYLLVMDNPKNLSLEEYDKQNTYGGVNPGLYSAGNASVTASQGVQAYYQDSTTCLPYNPCSKYVIPYKGKIYVLNDVFNALAPTHQEVLKQVFATLTFN